MAINVTDLKHLGTFRLAAVARWASETPPPPDPEAVDFSPPFVDLRPVLYQPVKRRSNVDVYPQMRIEVQVFEAAASRLNFRVAALVGAEVKVEVVNLCRSLSFDTANLTLPSGTLNDKLCCVIKLGDADIKRFLDASGPMKARLNENLLSLLVEIPAIKIDGKSLQGISENRVYLYRKKSIVFLPGVFGSQFEVEQGPGKKAAFPDFLDDKSIKYYWPFLHRFLDFFNLVWSGKVRQERLGFLECDSHGKPLVPAFKPMLLRLGGWFVYDTYTVLRNARKKRILWVPEDFLVYDLRLFAYDWRLDLTTASKEMMERLHKLQVELRGKPDTDDQIALAGHSTGGLIMRHMLGQAGCESIVSHAFFLNVPFRGAPKALSVFLTGCDPPGGNSMIDFVAASSLRNIVPCAPIVYHLAPSFAYPSVVAEIPEGIPGGTGPDREREKSALIQSAVKNGIYFSRPGLDDAPAGLDECVALAAGANDWSEFADEIAVHQGGSAAYRDAYPPSQNFKRYIRTLLVERKLDYQASKRHIIGWNQELADKAYAFHQASEKVASSGAWASKSFIFYSMNNHTTGRVVLTKEKKIDCGRSVVALIYPHNSTSDYYDGVAHPPEAIKQPELDDGLLIEQWIEEEGRLTKQLWSVTRAHVDGDGTVPLRSLLGFGGSAKVFKPLPGDPKHVPAPNSEWLWDRVINVLQGDDVSEFLDHSVDTINGTRGNA